jgi:phosphomevalonate kinase
MKGLYVTNNILLLFSNLDMYDILFVGGGPANLFSAQYLSALGSKLSFLVVDIGKKIEERNHDSEVECATGIGGNGLYSDGKFSHYPAGTELWKMDKYLLEKAYILYSDLMSKYYSVPSFPYPDEPKTDFDAGECWKLKDYETHYLSLDERYDLVKRMTCEYTNKILTETEVIGVSKGINNYVVKCQNISKKEEFDIVCKKIVFGGGRFMPLFIKKIGFIPTEFKRVELGVRLQGSADSKLYNVSSNIDPKFIIKHDDIEYKTFCWCRSGETVCTNFNGIKTWSGRSDCEPTGLSNFGFNIKFRNDSYMALLYDAIETKPFSVPFNDDHLVPESYRTIYSKIKTGLSSFLELWKIKDLSDFMIKGPTIEGIGYYPITDEYLKIPNEEMYVVGDSTGKFRGIVASMLSGAFVAAKLIDEERNKKNIFMLSGKRFNGKGITSHILKKFYESKGKRVFVIAFSYFLKKQFCEMNGLDLDRFISDHEYKDSFRDSLTAYLDTCEYESFTRMLIRAIDCSHFGEYDFYIIDDVRCFDAQVKYVLKHCSNKWNVQIIRINATDESRQKRGWVKSKYDEHMCENDLDNYEGFNSIIDNDGSIEDLEKKVLSLNLFIV